MHFFIYEFNNESGNVLNEHTLGNLNDALEYYQKLISHIGLAHIPEGDLRGLQLPSEANKNRLQKRFLGATNSNSLNARRTP